MRYWTHSITLVPGCTPVSEGCWNCWSAGNNHRFADMENDLTVETNSYWYPDIPAGHRVYSGEIRIREDRLPELLKGRKPRVIQIWNDLWHPSVPYEFIADAYYTFAKTTHTILVLTKRAKRMSEILSDILPSPNIWHGVTCENQPRADERIPLQVPGKRWLSIEPLLSEIHIRAYLGTCECGYYESEHGDPTIQFTKFCTKFRSAISQIIVGCETGPHARPCKVEWIESIVEQCREAGVPCFVKAINYNGKITSDISQFPESVRVRELAWRKVL